MEDIEDFKKHKGEVNPHICRLIIDDLLKLDTKSFNDREKSGTIISKLFCKYKSNASKRDLGLEYQKLMREDPIKYPLNVAVKNMLIKNSVRSDSGIINVSVVMPPDNFSCRYNCYFCPNETIKNGAKVDMPRSYLSNEDAVRRAAGVDFDAVRQVHVRLKTLEQNGHPIDKIEFRILGGTFSSYSREIADNFIRDLYFGANTYYENRSERYSIIKEQEINESALVHVVGLGVETRPDEINFEEITRLRMYGCTRVEIGVQHTDDALLRRVNRGHGIRESKTAIRLLKDYGFKVEIHIMTNLPGSTPEGDMECYKKVLVSDPDLIPDYMKDYPCLDVSFTEIKKWKENGKWKPYSDDLDNPELLNEVLIYRQLITPPWVRVNRVQRDFALAKESNDFLGYTSDTIKSNLGDIIKQKAEERGVYCNCIRCRELRNDEFDPNKIKYLTYKFKASGGIEYFISAEIPRPNRNLLLGFIRLRISSATETSGFIELQGNTAIIRELHVYGKVQVVGYEQSSGAQHIGIGKHLLKMAEEKAITHKADKMAIISGIGVRNYYKKQGYNLDGTYMIKKLEAKPASIWLTIFKVFICLIFLNMILYKL